MDAADIWALAAAARPTGGVGAELPGAGEPAPALRKIWADYKIGVVDAPKTIQGVTVHNISHTEAAYLADTAATSGLGVYPFRAAERVPGVASLSVG